MLNTKKWWTSYTLGFCCVVAIMLILFAITEKSFLWYNDGYQQHFTAVRYFGMYIKNALSTGQFPMIDFNNGEGLDILTTMGYYGFGDPLNVVFCFATERSAEYLYALMILVRWYLCGITFGVFASKFFKSHLSIATGCIIYAFSGYLMYFAPQAPTFMNGAMYLPLILYSLETAFENRKYSLLVIVTGLMWFANFYMAAVVTMLAMIYAIIRIIIFFNKSHFGNYVKIIGAYILGTLLSSIILFPMIYAFISCGRGEAATGYQDSMLHYSLAYYLTTIKDAFSPVNATGYWNAPYKIHLNFLPIALPAVLLFLRHKTAKRTYTRFLKYGLLCVSVFAAVPLFGKIFNGFAYVTHRWAFGFSFAVALVVVWGIPMLIDLPKSIKISVYIASLFCGVLIAISCNVFVSIISLVLLLCLCIILLKGKMSESVSLKFSNTCATLFILATFLFNGYIGAFTSAGASQVIQKEYPVVVDEDEFYRISEPFAGNNHSSIVGYKGVTSYYSISPKSLGDYYINSDLNTARMTFWSFGLDDRAVLNTLSSVKYYTAPQNEFVCVPYGFVYAYSQDGVDVYINENVLPIGYVYEQTLPVSMYANLNSADKEIALLQYAVVNDSVPQTGMVRDDILEFRAIEVSYTEESISSGTQITFNAPTDSEIYLIFKNATTTSTGLKTVSVTSENFCKYFFVRGPQNHCYFPNPVSSINLGYSNGGLATYKINYVDSDVTYDELCVYALPMSIFRDEINILSESVLTDISYSDVWEHGEQNYISGRISVQKDGVLQLGVPYSEGWKVFIDEHEVETFSCGLKYIGVNIGAGEHTVKAVYRTPMLTHGLVVSLISLFIFLVLAYRELRISMKRLLSFISDRSLCKFLIAGCITTTCDYVMYMIMSTILPINIAKMLSMSLACVLSYVLNKFWSFRSGNTSPVMQFGKFIGAQVLNIGINTMSNYMFYSLLHNKTIAFILATAIAMSVNFILQKYWVFKKKKGDATC